MAREQEVEYISDLEPEWPSGNEPISHGDDHLRNIKKSLKGTFPNIDGEVAVGQDKLNELDINLPGAPTAAGSILHNKDDKWTETEVIRIDGDAAYVPGLAGYGDVALYVNNDGQIIAAAMGDNPALQHGLDGHTDVSYTSEPNEDDILVFNGSEWVNTPNRTGNMFKPFEQPKSVGSGFVMTGSQSWQSSAEGADGFYTFTVPSDMRFSLVAIHENSSTSGAGLNAEIIIDGVDIGSLSQRSRSWPDWYGDEGYAGPNIEVKDEVRVKWDGTEDSIQITGYFFEV